MNETNMKMTVDGNTAAAYVAYALSDVAAIYPITPSTTMAELCDQWAAEGRKNIFGQTLRLSELQSEAGAAGAVHGALTTGALTTTFTASQGLLLMIPNMYKIAGELLPCVFHVSARTISTHALSIFGDHSDVMACRQTGFAMLASASVQECMDLAAVAHMATLTSSVPFVHFFDGFRTSHEIQKINGIPYETLEQMADKDAIARFRARALTPERPKQRGTAQNPDIFFQNREACNRYYDQAPQLVEQAMDALYQHTGRRYHLFDYYGAPDAERVIVMMGSGSEAAQMAVEHARKNGEKVGLVQVRLYRPFSAMHLLNALPQTVQRIAVLDRTKEPGALGEPLYQDVVSALHSGGRGGIRVVGGRYGLASKEFTPSMAKAVLDLLKEDAPASRFTVGIDDDVTHLSLPVKERIHVLGDGVTQCKFYGLGSDGTVGANKNSIKIVGDHTDLYAQGYFVYDSKKSGGVTVSHLRFGKAPIKAPYQITSADFVACHNPSYVTRYAMVDEAKEGGVFLLNAPWNTVEELEHQLPASLKRQIAGKKLKFYVIDAIGLAQDIGLGGRINMIMMSAFFKLTGMIPMEQAVGYMKDAIQKSYGRKGEKIVQMNYAAVDAGLTGLTEIDYPASWADCNTGAVVERPDASGYFDSVARPILALEGDGLPVSAFSPDGEVPLGTTQFEKRGIAVNVPRWIPENCIQCNQCSYVCPHAVIRPYLVKEDMETPAGFTTLRATGKGLEGLQFRIQLSPLDCTGCGNCADVCPAKEKALVMRPFEEEMADQRDNWNFAAKLPMGKQTAQVKTVKDSQFAKPLFEFSGACAGCGETPYIKLATQLFGDRMLIANATGCSSIYGGSAPTVPYVANFDGHGPAWANSLFEDNAEFGFGFYLSTAQQRERLAMAVEELSKMGCCGELDELLADWLHYRDDGEASRGLSEKIKAELPVRLENAKGETERLLKEIEQNAHLLTKPSIWMFGGDGWAYDIDFGGLDHVIASGEDVNILIFDTEVYSNTGGQSSKSTQLSAVAKFAYTGKRTAKKDLGRMAMTYGYVYVASVSLGANQKQYLDALKEAEAYKGPSVIICYAPCISHGIKAGMGKSIAEEKRAVESGYWPLYRFHPDRAKEGQNPLTIDSKAPTMELNEFLGGELRYASLAKQYPDLTGELHEILAQDAHVRREALDKMARE